MKNVLIHVIVVKIPNVLFESIYQLAIVNLAIMDHQFMAVRRSDVKVTVSVIMISNVITMSALIHA